MNCYEHNDAVAVASCPCGKALCVECQKKHQPPTCESCYVASLTGLRSKTIMRLWANGAFFLAYLDAFFQPFDSSSLHNLALLMALAWGFLGFRWLLDAFLALTGLAIFASFEGWGTTYFFGSLICSIGGIAIIPIQVIAQILQLRRLKEALKPTGVAPLVGTTGSPA